MPSKIKNIFSLNYCTLPISLYLYQNIHSIFVSHILCPAYLQNRDRAEGGAEGALAPPLLFFKNKNQLNKKYFNKKFSFTHFSLAPPLVNLLCGPCRNGRVEYGPILVTRVMYPCVETTKLKRKKEQFQIYQAKSKFLDACLATRQSFHSLRLQQFQLARNKHRESSKYMNCVFSGELMDLFHLLRIQNYSKLDYLLRFQVCNNIPSKN